MGQFLFGRIGTNLMKKYVAEAFGTFLLVFVGCGAAVFAGATVGHLGVAFSFGLGLIMAAYIIGGISGCHINPAVTVGAWAAGRISKTQGIGYIIGQVVGAILAAFAVLIIAQGQPDYTISMGLGQNGFGNGYNGGYNIISAVLFEFLATLIFVTFWMEVTEDKDMSRWGGFLIGLCLIGIHIVGIQITGVSVNPARSIGPALFAGPYAIAQLPIFIIAPLAGGLVGGYLSKSRMLSASDKDGAGEKAIASWTKKAQEYSAQATGKIKSATASATATVKDSVGSVTNTAKNTAKKTSSSTKDVAGDVIEGTASVATKTVKSAAKSATKASAKTSAKTVTKTVSKATETAKAATKSTTKSAAAATKSATDTAAKTVKKTASKAAPKKPIAKKTAPKKAD